MFYKPKFEDYLTNLKENKVKLNRYKKSLFLIIFNRDKIIKVNHQKLIINLIFKLKIKITILNIITKINK